MPPLLIGYARVSTDDQDLTAQRDALGALGVTAALRATPGSVRSIPLRFRMSGHHSPPPTLLHLPTIPLANANTA